jgi:hypothetical protein
MAVEAAGAVEAIGRWTEAACFGPCRHIDDTTQIGNTNKGTYSLYCSTVHEPDVAACTLWVYGSVPVVLFERTCGIVRPIANVAITGS